MLSSSCHNHGINTHTYVYIYIIFGWWADIHHPLPLGGGSVFHKVAQAIMQFEDGLFRVGNVLVNRSKRGLCKANVERGGSDSLRWAGGGCTCSWVAGSEGCKQIEFCIKILINKDFNLVVHSHVPHTGRQRWASTLMQEMLKLAWLGLVHDDNKIKNLVYKYFTINKTNRRRTVMRLVN